MLPPGCVAVVARPTPSAASPLPSAGVSTERPVSVSSRATSAVGVVPAPSHPARSAPTPAAAPNPTERAIPPSQAHLVVTVVPPSRVVASSLHGVPRAVLVFAANPPPGTGTAGARAARPAPSPASLVRKWRFMRSRARTRCHVSVARGIPSTSAAVACDQPATWVSKTISRSTGGRRRMAACSARRTSARSRRSSAPSAERSVGPQVATSSRLVRGRRLRRRLRASKNTTRRNHGQGSSMGMQSGLRAAATSACCTASRASSAWRSTP